MTFRSAGLAAALILTCARLVSEQTSTIQGVIRDQAGVGVGGLAVKLLRDDAVFQEQRTDADGIFRFEAVPPGRYAVTFTAPGGKSYHLTADAAPGATVHLSQEVIIDAGLVGSITVYSASRETESILSAPAAVNSVGDDVVPLYGAAGQVPNLLAGIPGAELTQNGLYDYNFNLRGFNTPLNRRVATSIDGRNPDIPLLGNPEWSSLALMTDDLDTIEVLSGPSASLYGENAYNGVVEMTTKAPRDSLGGRLRFTFGERGTVSLEGRLAQKLGRGWYLKVLGGYLRSNDFSQSRNKTVEYPGLPMEAIPLPTRRDDLASGSVRADKYFSGDALLTMEGGVESLAGPVFVVGTGRALSDNIRTWTRAHYVKPGWSFNVFDNTRDSPSEPALGSGVPITERDRNVEVELQANRKLGSKTDVVAGANYVYEFVDTADQQGIQTLLSHAISAHRGGAFGEVRRRVGERLTLTARARVDASTIFDTQFSPRVAALYRISAQDSVWASFSDAFQVANYAELFVRVPAGLPVDLSALETALQPLLGGVSLGLGSVPVLALGNPNLRVEKVRSGQAGYRRTTGKRNLFSVDYYYDGMRDFITDLLPGVNPTYGPYVPPPGLSAAAAAAVASELNSAVPGLTNGPGGVPWIVYSLTNAGHVSSMGVEAQDAGWIGRDWRYSLNCSWFDYSFNDLAARTEVHPNAPAYKAFAEIGYWKPRFSADVRYRWNDAFYFANGIFRGPVPTYSVVDLGARYQVSPRWELGVNVSNLLNNEHYEIFGGDILRRMALGYIAYNWK